MNESKTTYLSPIESMQHAAMVQLEAIKDNEKGLPYTWGATPLLLSGDILTQQASVKRFIASLFKAENVAGSVSDDIAEYMEGLHYARTAQREMRNTDSYSNRGVMMADDMPLEILSVIEAALRGSASPAELLFVAQILEIPTIELASLTHPYGQRIKLLKKMRPAVNDAIRLMGGVTIDDRKNRRYEVTGSDNHYDTDQMKVMAMTRKTDFGLLPDNTEILERSSFVLILDELPSRIRKEILSIKYGQDWSRSIGAIDGLEDFIDITLENDRYDIAPPLATTVVARHRGREAVLLSEAAMRQRQKEHIARFALNPSLI